MKHLLLCLLLPVVFSSCQRDQILVKVCETDEKLVFENNVYEVNDTIILHQHATVNDLLVFEVDHNWISFPEDQICLAEDCYYKAVVIKTY